MTPVEIIQGAAKHGVQLLLASNGAIKVSGEAAAVSHWTPLIRKQKDEILRLLKQPEGGANSEEAKALLSKLGLFRFDLVAQEIDADFDQSGLTTVNNMAWEFMKIDGLSFDVAINLAAEIVVHCGITACEAAYEDVQTLWKKLKRSDAIG
jgi:hypothetical protein